MAPRFFQSRQRIGGARLRIFHIDTLSPPIFHCSDAELLKPEVLGEHLIVWDVSREASSDKLLEARVRANDTDLPVTVLRQPFRRQDRTGNENRVYKALMIHTIRRFPKMRFLLLQKTRRRSDFEDNRTIAV